MDVLNALHEVTTIGWRLLQLIEALHGRVEAQGLLVPLAELVKAGVVVHEDGVAKLLRVGPPRVRCADDVDELVVPLVLRHGLRPLLLDLGLQADCALRQRGPPTKKTKLQQLVTEQIVLRPDQRQPALTWEDQHIFRALHCDAGTQHYKVLNVHSVKGSMSLLCYICNGKKAAKQLAAEAAECPARKVSKKERRLLQDIDSYGVAGERRAFVHEVKVFVGQPDMHHFSVDVLIYDGAISTDPAAAKRGLLVYWDGEHHLRHDGRRHAQQLEADRRNGIVAARLGYNTLRISCKDASKKMQTIDAAWEARSPAGKTMVSRRWNQSARLVLLRLAGGA